MRPHSWPLAFVAAGVLMLSAVEVGLRVLERTGLVAAPRAAESYPANPKRYIKIAVFGESPVAGFGTTRTFVDILRHELRNRHPNKLFFIKNYGINGGPFHGYQAPLIKRLLGHYDYILIYSGMNEHAPYIDDQGRFRLAAQKKNYDFGLSFTMDEWHEALITKSHVYARLRKWRYKNLAPPQPLFIVNRQQIIPAEIQPPLVPALIEERMINDFGADINAVASLAQKSGKYILAAGAILDDTWRPFVSTQRPGLSVPQRDRFRALLAQGTARLVQGDYRKALAILRRASSIDPDVAILNYRIGQAHWANGEHDAAHVFFIKSIVQDGLPLRYAARLNLLTKAAATRGGYFRYLDTTPGLNSLVDRGFGYRKFFSDMEHPNLMGHAFLAQNFLCALEELPPLGPAQRHDCLDWRTADPQALAMRYHRELGVTKDEESEVAWAEAAWHYRMRSLSAYPQDFLAMAEARLQDYRAAASAKPESEVKFLFGEALIEAARNRSSRRVVGLLNEALHVQPEYVVSQWITDMGNGETTGHLLESLGITYNITTRSFQRL